MNKITSTSDYTFEAGEESHTNQILEPVIFRYMREYHIQSVLDMGCGNGTTTRDIAAQGATVVGMDPSANGIEAARKNCPAGKFYELGVYESPDKIAEADFDMVVSLEVVEHIFYPRELPRFAHKKIKPGGIFLVSTPYHGYLKNLALAILGKWDRHHTVLWDGGHIKFWSRATLTQLLEEEGFEVIGFHGCGRIPYLWKSMIVVGRKKG